MRVFRVGLPLLTGLALLLIAMLSVGASLQSPSLAVVEAVRGAVLAGAAAVVLLLTAIAIARRTRAGQVLGVLVAFLAILGGVALVVVELPYLADGGLGAALGGGVMVLAGIWIVVWLIYGLVMLRGRASFAADWQPMDRRFGIVVGSIAAIATAAFLAAGFVLEDGTNAAANDQAARVALVVATSIDAHVIGATYRSSADGSMQVQTLTLELSFTGGSEYRLARAPTLCLTDVATSLDPGYKPRTFCWGTGGAPLVLSDAFSDLTMPSTSRRIRLDLARGDSPCAFGAGSWEGQVQIAPLGIDAGAEPEAYAATTSFRLDSAQAPAASGTAVADACLASTVSP